MNPKEKAIYDFKKKYTTKSLHVLTRIGTLQENRKIVKKLLDQKVTSYTLTLEGKDEGNPHIHILLFSVSKKLNILPIRKHFKESYEDLGLSPKKYENGMLNIKRLQNAYKVLCYVQKDYAEATKDYYITHNIDKTLLRYSRKDSYVKIKTLSVEINRLLELVKTGDLSPIDATVKYRKMRRKIPKDIDPNWIRFLKKCMELEIKEEEYLEDTTRAYQELKISRD